MGYVLLAVIVAIGSITGSIWVFMRPGGIVAGLLQTRDERYQYLSDSLLAQHDDTAKMVSLVRSLETRIDEYESSVGRRISSFESRYGKASKEARKNEALALISSMANQPQNTEVNHVGLQ